MIASDFKNIVFDDMKYIICFASMFMLLVSCDNQEDMSPDFDNDFMKKTTGPLIVGEPVEFMYGMGTIDNHLATAEAEASIEGTTGTGFERHSWYTDQSGVDIPVLTVTDSTTIGRVSTAEIVDTNAVTLRYKYVVPEEARGGTVSFKFNATNSVGDHVGLSTPEYQVSRMDMEREILLTDGDAYFFSIADMAVYTEEEIVSESLINRIDFVYLYRETMDGYAFGHALVSPDHSDYLNDVTLPANWESKTTRMEKRDLNMRDAQLKGDAPEVYIDDRDLEEPTLENSTNYAFGVTNDSGVLMRTEDDKYTAYIYINNINNTDGEMLVSIKRLEMN